MNFTNKLIKDTYHLVGVNNGFSSDGSLGENTSDWQNVCDGAGIQSNVYTSIITDTAHYPHLKYDVNNDTHIILPGNNIDSNKILVGDTEGTTSFKESNITVKNDGIQIKDITYPFDRFGENSILVSNNNKLESNNQQEALKYYTETSQIINKQIAYFEPAWGSACPTYSTTVNLNNFVGYSDNLVTIQINIETCVYHNGYNKPIISDRIPYVICKYGNIYFKVAGPATDINGNYTRNWGDDGGDRPVDNYNVMGGWPGGDKVINYNKEIAGLSYGILGKSNERHPVCCSILLPALQNNTNFSIYSLLNHLDGHKKIHHLFSSSHRRCAVYLKATLSKVTRLIK